MIKIFSFDSERLLGEFVLHNNPKEYIFQVKDKVKVISD